MKHTIANFFGKAMMIGVVGVAGSLAAFSQNDSGGGRLAGTWDAVITIRDCATGAPDPNPFGSIANFNQGGTFLGSTSGRPQASRTPEHGVWRHVGGNRYEFKFKSFNFNPLGVAVSYVVIRHDLELNDKADGYTSAGESTVYSLGGAQLAQGCSSAVGSRFDF